MTDETPAEAPAEGTEAPAEASAPPVEAPPVVEAPAAPAAPELTPQEQEAADAHAAITEQEQGWSGAIEARLAAIEEHLGIGQDSTSEEAN